MKMTTYAEKFKNDRYLHVENLLTNEECDEAIRCLIQSHDNGNFMFDNMCDKSLGFSGVLRHIQYRKKELFEEILGLKLIPTYDYSRIYKPGEILQKHIDRYACEISVTITLGYIGKIWPIYFLNKNESAENAYFYLDKMSYRENKSSTFQGDSAFSPFMDTSNKLKFVIEKGSGVFYRGTELVHWRDEYVEGDEQAQLFFHFVNANGPYRDLNHEKQHYHFGD